MRKAFIGSFILHVVAIVAIAQVIAFTQVDYVDRPVYTVDLVGAVATARASAPKTQPAPPKPAPVEEKKVEEKEDQMPAPPTTPKKPEKKKSEVPTTDPSRIQKPDTSLAGDVGEAAPGPPGDTPAMGSVSFDGGDFPFASYVNRMRQKIATAWEVPVGTEGLERSAVIYFRVRKDGGVSNVTVEKSSGLQLFDRSCQRAVIEAAPLPPLPREYRDDFIGVHFSFLFQPSQ